MIGFRAAALLFAACVGGAAHSQPAPAEAFSPIGLPSSRSPLPVFNRFMSLPPFTARVPGRGEWFIAPTAEIAQTMIGYWDGAAGGSAEPKAAADFESLSLELPAAYGISGRTSIVLDVQALYLWGGLLDGTIEGFHGLFGFLNGGREYFDRNQVEIDIPTRNGFRLGADRPVLLISDPVLGAAFRLRESRRLTATGRLFAALPLGLGKGLAGSDLPQLGAGAYADWRAGPRFTATGSAGAVLPFESFGWSGTNPHPTAQARLSALIEIMGGLFLFADFNLRTSPIRAYVVDGDRDFFALPNLDLLVGFLFSGGKDRADGTYASFAVREDSFGNNASDIGFMAAAAFIRR